jgi:uncharacterized protein (TIGR03663 family)
MTGPPAEVGKAGTARGWKGAIPWLLLALAGGLRLFDLEARPLHHDEGSNAIFLLRLLRQGTFEYDPANFHGPLPFYLSALALWLGGTTTVMLRLAPAIAGTLIVPLALGLRREIGLAGATAAGLLLAVSPSMVYYSRDNIHEIVLAALTLLLAVAATRGAASRGRAWWLAAGAAAGGILATKETAPLVFGSLLAGAGAAWALGARPAARPRGGAVLLAAALVALPLYSHFFADPAGLLEPLRALGPWGRRAVLGEGHEKPWWYYLGVIGREEWAILAAACAGAVIAWRRRHPAAIGLAVWAGAALLAYSSIPYKTPWLVINIVLPLGLLGGFTAGAILTAASTRPHRAAIVLILLAAAAGSGGRAVDLSLLRPDEDGASPLIYVQTRRDALRLVARLEGCAARDPAGRGVPIAILSPDYLPLNWYLRDFPNVGYYGRLIDAPSGPLVIARVEDAGRVAESLGPGYRQEEYDLRPGVRLALFIREPPGGGL